MFLSEIDEKRVGLFKKYYAELELDTDKVKYFTSVKDEYNSLVNGVGLYPYSWGNIIEMNGQESLDYLHRISTNSIKDLPVNKLVKTLFTNEKGRIIDRTLVINLEDKVLLLGSSANQKKLFGWINKYIIMEDIKLAISSDKYSILDFYGPQKNSFLILFFGSDITSLKENEVRKVTSDGFSFQALKYRDFGQEIFSIIAETNAAEYLIQNMMDNKSVFDFNLIGGDAYNIFRVEKGIPAAPDEINDLFNPYETGIINDVSFTKGCFIGQEVIARLETYDKVKRTLKGILFEEDPGQEPMTLYSNGNEAGNITSVIKSTLLNKYIGLALVNRNFNADGTILSARAASGTKFKVEVTSLPFRK